jgi:hypothetical protein
MTKTSSLALAAAALIAVAGFSVPAFADDDSGTSFNDDLVTSALAERGIQVAGLAETATGNIRATVVLPDGSTEFQYFDGDSLQPLNSDGRSRVLSRLDVGVQPAQPGLNSLTWEDPPGND